MGQKKLTEEEKAALNLELERKKENRQRLKILIHERDNYQFKVNLVQKEIDKLKREIEFDRTEFNLPDLKEFKDHWEGKRRPTGC